MALLSVKEVAAQLGISERTVHTRLKDGEIKSFMLGGLRKVEQADLDAYVERLKQEHAA